MGAGYLRFSKGRRKYSVSEEKSPFKNSPEWGYTI